MVEDDGVEEEKAQGLPKVWNLATFLSTQATSFSGRRGDNACLSWVVA